VELALTTIQEFPPQSLLDCHPYFKCGGIQFENSYNLFGLNYGTICRIDN